ncbi:MAG: tRNA (guanosine(46)-N7)-methyltransferase TrmB [Geminicoccaceae bacterium]|nr:tRNA (guanosine(46)-N7)-methyltransferase TrmB [Geminicoccaceae bacterium]
MGADRPRRRAEASLQLNTGVRRQVYGRHLAPRLRPVQKARLETMLPKLRLDIPEDGRLVHLPERLWLEIGFGGGEHLAWQAANNPDVGFIGVEPFMGGVVKLLQHIESDDLKNVRVVVDDARLLLAALPERSVERVFILFPDPWPKRRHWKRRIVCDAVISEVARVMRSGGLLRIATDHADYRQWILEVMLRAPGFEWQAERPADWRERGDDWPPTRYEEKAVRENRPPVFLRFGRVARHQV